MTKPRAFISRRIPRPALEIIASACDYTMWDDLMPARAITSCAPPPKPTACW